MRAGANVMRLRRHGRQMAAKVGRGGERQVRLPGGIKWKRRQKKIWRQRPSERQEHEELQRKTEIAPAST